MEIRYGALILLATIAMALWQWWRIPRPRGRVFDLLGVVLLIALPLEVAGYITNHFRINNSPAYDLYMLIEAFLVLGMVRAMLPEWKAPLIAGALVIALSFSLNLWIDPTMGLLYFESVLVIALVNSVFCLAVLWHMAQYTHATLTGLPLFWFFTGLLIYFAGMIPFMGSFYFVFREDEQMASKLFGLMNLLAITRYVFTAYACHVRAVQATRIQHG